MTPLSPQERSEIQAELRRALEAETAGNAGKARVCARRACGVALRAWHRAQGRAGLPADAQSLLRIASSGTGMPAGVREAAARLSASVTGPGISADPIADANALIAALTSGGPPVPPPTGAGGGYV